MTAPVLQPLREGSAEDLDAVMHAMDDAFDAIFGEAWTHAQCHSILRLPGVWMTVAERDNAVAGFALSRIVGDEAELLLLAVRRDRRRGGIGRALVERTMAIALARGAARLFLEVREGNAALALYRTEGFAQIGRRPRYYRGGDGSVHDALTLCRDLAGLSPPQHCG